MNLTHEHRWQPFTLSFKFLTSFFQQLRDRIDKERREMRQRFLRINEIQNKSRAPLRFPLEWSKFLWSAAIIRTRFFAAEGLDYIDRFKHYKWLKFDTIYDKAGSRLSVLVDFANFEPQFWTSFWTSFWKSLILPEKLITFERPCSLVRYAESLNE